MRRIAASVLALLMLGGCSLLSRGDASADEYKPILRQDDGVLRETVIQAIKVAVVLTADEPGRQGQFQCLLRGYSEVTKEGMSPKTRMESQEMFDLIIWGSKGLQDLYISMLKAAINPLLPPVQPLKPSEWPQLIKNQALKQVAGKIAQEGSLDSFKAIIMDIMFLKVNVSRRLQSVIMFDYIERGDLTGKTCNF